MNDVGKVTQEAYPGEAVHMTGFKEIPEVGNPLYVVRTQEESNFIINRIKQREAFENARRMAASGQLQVSDIKQKIGKLTKFEKQAIKSGNRQVLYEKLGLLEERDLQSMYSKFGIKKGNVTSEADLQEQLEGVTKIGKKRQRSRYA